jgi:peptidyl-dipeptidase Dcp
MVLSRGNTEDLAEMYRGFTGHDPDIQPYLEYYGLTGAGTAPTTPAPAATPAPAQQPSVTPERG